MNSPDPGAHPHAFASGAARPRRRADADPSRHKLCAHRCTCRRFRPDAGPTATLGLSIDTGPVPHHLEHAGNGRPRLVHHHLDHPSNDVHHDNHDGSARTSGAGRARSTATRDDHNDDTPAATGGDSRGPTGNRRPSRGTSHRVGLRRRSGLPHRVRLSRLRPGMPRRRPGPPGHDVHRRSGRLSWRTPHRHRRRMSAGLHERSVKLLGAHGPIGRADRSLRIVLSLCPSRREVGVAGRTQRRSP